LDRTLDHLFSIPWLALQSRGAIFLVEDDPDFLVMKAHRGFPANLLRNCGKVPLGVCLCGEAAAGRKIVFAKDDEAHDESQYCGTSPHGHYCLPVVSDDRLFGVLTLFVEPGHKGKPEEKAILSSVADLLAGIVKHKLGQDSLRRSEERFDLAVRGTDAGIWDWDLRTNEVYFSPRWKSMLGYQEDEIANSYFEWERRLHPDDRERALATIQAYLDGKSPDYELEHRLRHKDRTYRWILARGAAVFDENGKPYRMVGSHIDVTRRKQMAVELGEHEAQLVAAQRIQQHLLPAEPPSLTAFDIAGKLHPAAFAAGDFFDYLPLPDGSLGIVIGDVTGHGFAPALLTALTHAYLHTAVRTETDIARMLSQVNGNLIQEVEGDRFVTLVFACLDPQSRSFTYASAGHPTGYVLDASGNVRARLKSTGRPLAVLPDTVFPVSEPILLHPGDAVILITDGVLEARSPEEEMFGQERFLETVMDHVDKTAREIIDGLFHAICEFSQREPSLDDITVVVVKVNDVISGRIPVSREGRRG
jgi:PAS domain S-box-containing protein